MAVVLVPIDDGERIPIDKAVVFIGRHPECDFVLTSSRKVSRKHCCIAQVNNTLFVRDLGSMNGVRLNGHRVQRQAEIKVGDQLAIGDVHYKLAVESGSPKRSKVPKVTQVSPQSVEPPSTSRQQQFVKPAQPLDLSQDFPVAIPNEDLDIIPLEDIPETGKPTQRAGADNAVQRPQPQDEDIRLLENELAELQRQNWSEKNEL